MQKEMMRKIKIIVILAFLVMVGSLAAEINSHTDGSPEGVASKNMVAEELVDSLNGLSLTVMQAIHDMNGEKRAGGENYVFSPVSMAFDLGMVANGASENDQKSILGLLGANGYGMARLNDVMGKFHDKFNISDSACVLSTENSVWCEKSVKLNKLFVRICKKVYRAPVFYEDLSTVRTMEKINAWTSEKTNGMIPCLLTEPMKSSTGMALVNTTYVKGEWCHGFDKSRTRQRVFHNSDGTRGNCMMMTAVNMDLACYDCESFLAVRMELDNGRLAMTFVLPDEKHSVRDVCGQMGHDFFSRWNEISDVREFASVMIPVWDVEYGLDLKNVLPADISAGMADGGPVISGIYQKARVRVDESGAEAAAATISMIDYAPSDEMLAQRRKIVLDRPFMYFMTDVDTGVILFAGEICRFEPSARRPPYQRRR